MFYSETRRPSRISQPKTNNIEPIYKEAINTKTGKKYLKKVDEVDVYEKIQAAAEGVTLKEIIKRYGINPFESAEKIDEFGTEILDYTNQPKNLMEALEITNEAKNVFDNLSKEIKQIFNNNFSEFLAGSQNGKLNEVIKIYKKNKIASETKNDIIDSQTKDNQINQAPNTEKGSQGVKYE